MEFLGHQIGKGVDLVPQSRAKAIAQYNRPTTKMDYEHFWEWCLIIGNFSRNWLTRQLS